MPTSTVLDINQKIFNFFETRVNEQALASGFVQRKSKLTPLSFFKALMGCCLSMNKMTLDSLRPLLIKQGIFISRQGLHERMNERGVSFVEALFSYSLKHFMSQTKVSAELHQFFSSVYLIDSSAISLPPSLQNRYKGYGGNASKAAVKLQVLYEQLEGQIKEITLTPGCKNDQGFDAYFTSIQPRALYLMDLGYFKLDRFKNMITGGAYFISRYFIGTTLFTPQATSIDLVRTLKKAHSCHEQQVLIGSEAKLNVRLIAQRLPDARVKERIRKLRRDYQRRGLKLSQTKLTLCRWNLFITNVPEQQLDAAQVMATYGLRWQIELLFKVTKSWGFRLDVFRSNKPARVMIELYTKLIGILFLFLFCSSLQQKNNNERSLFKACNYLFARAYDFIHALESLYKLKKFTREFLFNLNLFAVKEGKKNKNYPHNPSLEIIF